MCNNKTEKSIQGFSLAEIIIVTAVLAVIATISYGEFGRLFNKQRTESERLIMQKIRDAMEVYALKEGGLPLDDSVCDSFGGNLNSTMWSVQLSKYSELGPDQICFDSIGNKRVYKVFKDPQLFFGGSYSYDNHHATVLTHGINGVSETPSWTGVSGSAVNFNNVRERGDDILVKYTDISNKINLYKETLNRIEKIENSLERYARAKRAIAASSDVSNFDNFKFYPKDGRGEDDAAYFDADHGAPAGSAVDSISGTVMKATGLTEVLGMPEYYGKDAVTGLSMFYISNPGPDRMNPCTGSKSSPPYYSPIIVPTSNGGDPDGC